MPMPFACKKVNKGDDRVLTPGHDWGKPLMILHRKGNHLLIRRDGHMTWAGNWQPWEYAPTLYMVVEVKTDKNNVHGYTAHVLAEEEPGRKYRDCIKRFKEKVDATAT